MPTVALATAPPRITLRSSPAVPYDGAIAAARTCYSPRVIERSEITDKQRDSIGPLTFDGGHHTVFQHAHFEFGLENISRQLVWSVLHSYPFYNSEQSSQRYVKLNEPRAFVPPIDGEARAVYEAAVVRAWDRYAELSALLKDDALTILKDLRYVRPTTNPERLKQIDKDAEKRAIETARYVIPIGAFTSMVHTVSGIVLHRLQRMVNTSDTPHEARVVIGEAFSRQASHIVNNYVATQRGQLQQQIKLAVSDGEKNKLQDQLNQLRREEQVMNILIGAVVGVGGEIGRAHV